MNVFSYHYDVLYLSVIWVAALGGLTEELH